MCGLFFYRNTSGLNTDEIGRCLDSMNLMEHRGPDSDGALLLNSRTGERKWIYTAGLTEIITADFENPGQVNPGDFDLFFGHKRLSIIETNFTGHQPLQDHHGNIIVFNGEVYNYIEIRDELIEEGILFQTKTDTEVLLAAYNFWGTNCLSRFNGMWSLVIWDNRKKKIFASNDRFGVKPLYHRVEKNVIVLSSEVKPVLNAFTGRNAFNDNSFNRFLSTATTVSDEETFFANVFRFRPASFVCFDSNEPLEKLNFQSYFHLNANRQDKITTKDAVEQYQDLLESAVKIRLRADVPLGISLSGGLDSSAVYVLMRRILGRDHEIAAFSAVAPGEPEDESKFIDELGKDGLLTLKKVNPLEKISVPDYDNFLRMQETPLPRLTFYSQWCVSRLTHESGFVVLLCGQGADESIAGYHHHFYRYARNLIMRGRIFEYIKQVNYWSELKGIKPSTVHNIVLNEVELVLALKAGLKKLSTRLEEKWYCVKSLSEALKMDLLEYQLPHFLHADDRNGMAFSIETRHPFMDYRLIEFSLGLPDSLKIHNGWQKWILRESISELPEIIKWRKDKKGFSTPEKKIYPLLDDKIQNAQGFRQYNIDRFKHIYSELM